MKLKKNKYDLIVDSVCLILLIGVYIYIFIIWDSIPDSFSRYYIGMGEIDRRASKEELLVTPIIGWLIYIGMTVIAKFPKIWSRGFKGTVENKEHVYEALKSMLGTVKLLMVVVFVYLTISLAQGSVFSKWFFPISLTGIYGSLLYIIIKLNKQRK